MSEINIENINAETLIMKNDPEWISIKDELPRPHKLVLGYNPVKDQEIGLCKITSRGDGTI